MHTSNALFSGAESIEFLSRGLLLREKHVLLCKNVQHGHHYLPGGHVEPGESAEAACVREYIEETGLRVRVGESLFLSEQRFVQQGTPRHELTIVFHVELVDCKADASCKDDTPLLLPPAVVESRESKIAFVWMLADELAALPPAVFPGSAMRSWLLEALRMDGAMPVLRWQSSCASD